MGILTKFFTDDLAIDLGTVNTLIYAPSRGIVLNEPSAVAVNKYQGEVLAVGKEAMKLLGREPYDTIVHRPIVDGTISNFEVAQKMLACFIERALGGGGRSRRTRLVIAVPSASSPLEHRAVRDAARDIRASSVELIDEGLAAALGSGLDATEERAHLVVDVGGGTTNCTIVSSGAVVSSLSLRAAGNAMDEAIRDYLRSRFEVQTGIRTAEEIKKVMGRTADHPSALKTKDEERKEVVGKRVTDGMAKAVSISPAEVSEALDPVVREIIGGVRRAVEGAQPDVTSDLYHAGILLAGGGSLLPGLKERLARELRLPVRIADDPMSAVAIGAGHLLTDPEHLRRVAIREGLPTWQKAEETSAG